MYTLLPTVLACLLTFGAPLKQEAQPLVHADALEFLLALHEPGPGSLSVDVIEVDDMLVASVTRVLRVPGTEKVVMFRTTYVFPSTIYAHSVTSVGFHANEME